MSDNTELIPNKIELLLSLLKDHKNANALYKAGPYWDKKTKMAVKDIKRFGITDFRGGGNTIGAAFTDSAITDMRNHWNLGLQNLVSFFQTKTYPFNRLFDFQVRYSEGLFHRLNERINYSILNDRELLLMLKKFKSPKGNIKGGCKTYCNIEGENISPHIELGGIKTYFEIGGGFGSFVHCLLENYNNVRKVVYLDVVPNLYIGTNTSVVSMEMP